MVHYKCQAGRDEMLIKCLLDASYDYYDNLQAAQTTLEVFFFEFISETSARTPFIHSFTIHFYWFIHSHKE